MEDLQNQDMRKVFAKTFKANALRPAMLSMVGEAMTFRELHVDAELTAQKLFSMDINHGEEIIIIAENSFTLARLFFGAWQAGLVVTPINPQLPINQALDIISKVEPKAIIVSDSAVDDEYVEKLKNFYLVSIISSRQFSQSVFQQETFSVPQGQDCKVELFSRLDPDKCFLRVFTSGSTSAPKGVELSFNRLLWNELLFCDALGITPANRFYNFFPMSYLAGVHNLLLLPLSVGGSVVIGETLGGANMFTLWDDVRRLDIDTLWFTGAMLAMILQIRPDGDEAWVGEQIKLGLIGMAPVDESVKAQFEQRFGFKLHENFALSETAFISSSTPNKQATLGSKGSILKGVGVEIINDAGETMGTTATAENPGEIFINTYSLFLGYCGASETDNANLTDRGFFTGDLGYISDGELYVVGRKKDLIIRGGLNIAPAVVEKAVMEACDAVEVAVVGISDPIYGEEVCVALVPQGGQPIISAKFLNELLEGRLAIFQRPKHVLSVDRLPRGLTGKIDKKAVLALFEDNV